MTFTTRPTLRGTFGMVASTHWLASQSAMSVLERGGNAFDAAACAGFVLHVVEPHLNGPGGEVPAVVATADDPTPRVLNGQGPAPAGATVEHFRDLGLDLVPGSGPLAATIPGAVDAWLLLLRDHGTWPLRDVLEPAIGYARAGHPLVSGAVTTVATVQRLFAEHWPTSAALWLRDGKPPAPNAMFANPAYADTLERLAAEGEAAGSGRETQIDAARRAWREGFVAEEIAAFSRQPHRDSSGADHAGLLTGDDLASWSASWEEPATLEWNGLTVAKTQAWGQGPVLLQSLALLDALDDHGGSRPQRRTRRSPDGRGAQARPRRPGGVVRRPARLPAARAAGQGVRRRARCPGGRPGVRRATPGRAGRAYAETACEAHRPGPVRARRRTRDRRPPANPPSTSPAVPAATPATWTSSTAGAT